MRQMKQIYVLVVCCAALLLSACANTSGSMFVHNSLYDQGLSIITLMSEMVKSPEYGKMYSQNETLIAQLETAGQGDYTKPKAVYQVTVSEDLIKTMTQFMLMDELSPALKEYVYQRMRGMLATQLNQDGGAEALAASSITMAQKTFVCDTLDQTGTSYLYTYETGFPILISFTPGEDHTVLASGSFIFSKNFAQATEEELEKLFMLFLAELEPIELPA